jgi:hypothetical protein
MNDTKAYSHPKFGSKHELLYKLVTGNANAVKEATQRIAQAGQNRTPTSTRPSRAGSGFKNIEEEVAATPNRDDAFAKAANYALQQVKRRR